jgi:hypothetical protein
MTGPFGWLRKVTLRQCGLAAYANDLGQTAKVMGVGAGKPELERLAAVADQLWPFQCSAWNVGLYQ